MVGAFTSAENCANLGTKSPSVHRLRQPRQWKCKNTDEGEQRRGAVQTISDPSQGEMDLLRFLILWIQFFASGGGSSADSPDEVHFSRQLDYVSSSRAEGACCVLHSRRD